MAMMTRPQVTELESGAKYWEHDFDTFSLKCYVPANTLEGQTCNYGFRASLLTVLEEKKMTREEAVRYAESTGLSRAAAENDGSVLFVYPTCEGGWKNAGAGLYADLIREVRIDPVYRDGMTEVTDFFTRTFKGWFIRGAKFRADLYAKGEAADYAAKHLLRTLQGEYLWGPGEITPAAVCLEGLSVMPEVERTDIAVVSIGNSVEINRAFEKCEELLVTEDRDLYRSWSTFVKRFKMWCGKRQEEPDFEKLGMTEDVGAVTVHTSPDNRGAFRGTKTHRAGYFAYYNNGLPEKGNVPLMLGLHGGGDSSMYLTYVAEWWELAHKYGFLFVSVENHQNLTATELIELLEHLKKRYPVDRTRVYATGFSMGSGKTWDLYQEYPQYFAGMCPASALFPVYHNPFGADLGDRLNRTVPVPLFYSGGEQSHLPELPYQAESALERAAYAAEVQGLSKRFDLDFSARGTWEDPFWGEKADRTEVLHDESRGSDLTVRYYLSRDGVCRTAFASVSGQIHECRRHTCEAAWNFLSGFTRPDAPDA